MRDFLYASFCFLFIAIIAESKAQSYCQITTANSYSSTMPGITNFQLNTINRTSGKLECSHPCNSYINTGMSTTLEQGANYNVSISHDEDPFFFVPNVENNLRVWIDFNQDGEFTDPGEEVVTINEVAPGTNTASFTVPANATLGTTRMRVTAKMGTEGGHTAPTPCDIPADPLQYHGEVEDYQVTITAATGLQEQGTVQKNELKLHPNPFNTLSNVSYTLNTSATVSLEVVDMLGQPVKQFVNRQKQLPGIHQYSFASDETIVSGLYFVRLSVDQQTQTKKLLKY